MKKSEKIKDFLSKLNLEHIDISQVDCDEVETFEDIVQQLDDANAFDVEIIYYSKAMEYLMENDSSLNQSLGIAAEMGYEVQNLNSEALASLLASQLEREKFMEYENMITEFLDEVKDDPTYYRVEMYYKDEPTKIISGSIIKLGEVDEEEDDNIFFYIESEDEMDDLMDADGMNEFVVTSFEIINL